MVRNAVGHVHQQNALFETVSSVGARQGPIITGLAGHTSLATLKKYFGVHFCFSFPVETEQIVNGK